VVGVVVFGSRGAGAFVVADSDVDAFVLVTGSAVDAKRWSTAHGSEIEVWAMTLEEFRDDAMPGTTTSWNRPTVLRSGSIWTSSTGRSAGSSNANDD
jgi:hypothetical protein